MHPRDLEIQREEQKRADKLRREQELADLVWLMSSKQGRRIVWSMLTRAGVFRVSFNTNSMQMAFNEGQRNEGVRMFSDIQEACPDFYSMMALEQKENGNTDD